MNYLKKKLFNRISAFCLSAVMLLSQGSTVLADELTPEEQTALRQAMPVRTNEITNWPIGPVVSAEAAILMEASTGTILYEKNIHKREYPASMTKILTTLMATELCSLEDVVTFSHDAIFDTPRQSSHIAMDVGQKLTMEQCLNAILIRSANEVSYAVAEHITGTTDWSVFAEMMNKRALELGAINSHFANPNGLPDEDHYSTAYDLAMIGRAFFDNELLCKITLERRLEIPVSDTIKVAKIENNAMQIIPTGKYAYEPLIGCKTGYTEDARSCLISAAEKDGMRLICVVMRDEAPFQYEDTISLFNYGFSNFEKLNISQTETKYNIDNSDMFSCGKDIFGSSKPLLSLNKEDCIILPRTLNLKSLETSISYETGESDQAAIITYSYKGMDLGTIGVNFSAAENSIPVFEHSSAESEAIAEPSPSSVLFINIIRVFAVLGIIAACVFLLALLRVIMKRYSFSFRRRREMIKRKRRRRRSSSKNQYTSKYRDYDF